MSEAVRALPRVVFVDDNELAGRSITSESLGVEDLDVVVRHPESVEPEDLSGADLVVVDYFLQHWPERDQVDSASRSPMNGLAVAVTLRSGLLPSHDERRTLNDLPERPVAFALVSGNLSEASFGLPDEVLPHVFARENNLEWAFRRQDLAREGGQQIASLAAAVAELPGQWSATDAESQLWRLLDLGPSTGGWASEAKVDVLNCRPPIHELSERSHGLVLLRWLLHRILPYPCFLLDERQLCARLRVDSLGSHSPAADSLPSALATYEYSGVLQGFLGRRWWRAGVEDWIFRSTDGQAGDSSAVAALSQSKGATVETPWLSPVLAIKGDLSRYREFNEIEATVRVRPDDWPPFADDAYALLSDVDLDSRLRALVDPADRHRLRDSRSVGE